MPSPDTPKPAAGHLLKVLGVAFGLAIIVGNTIGSGILRTPGDIAAALPSMNWFFGVWIAGGLYALGGAMTMAELAVALPQSGGQYVYARRALGEYPGFVVGWTDWFSVCGSAAAGSIALGELSGALFPAIAHWQTPIAIATVLGFTAVHWIGVRSGDVTQKLLSVLKTLALLAIAAACFLVPRSADSGSAIATFPVGTAVVAALVLSFQNVIFTYDGWNGLVYFSGEVKNPAREIPRAMAWGVVTVALVYLALNAAFVYALGMGHLAGEKFAAAAAAKMAFGGTGERIVSAVMVVSLLGNVSAILMQAPRVPYAMASDGLLPRRMATVNLGGTPFIALAVSAAITLALVLSGTFETVLAISAFFFVMQYATTFTSLFVLRRNEPDLARPYKAWGYPVIPAIVLVGALTFLGASFVTDRTNSIHALYVLAASVPVFLISRRLVDSPR